jgi:predicted aconitase
MSVSITTYEAWVKSNRFWVHTKQGKHPMVRMYHIDARTNEQAREKAKKYGEPIRVQKAKTEDMFGEFELLPLRNDVYQNGNPYDSAVALDEMIWLKRNKRRNNMYKDKESIDK